MKDYTKIKKRTNYHQGQKYFDFCEFCISFNSFVINSAPE